MLIMISKHFQYGKYSMVYIIERCEMGMQWYHMSYGHSTISSTGFPNKVATKFS